MRYKNIIKPSNPSYDVVAEKRLADRVFTLLRLPHAKTDVRIKREILDRILADGRTIGAIEWWEKGGIVHKPRVPSEIIIVSKA